MKKNGIIILFFIIGLISYGQTKVISLAPAVTEIIYYLGMEDNLIGVTTACDYPEQAKLKPKAGDFTMPNMEKIVSMKPDIVIGMDLNDKKMEKFSEFGIKYINLKIEKIEDIGESVFQIGKMLNEEKRGKEKKDKFLSGIKKFSNDKRETKIKILPIIYDDPVMTAGGDTLINGIIEAAGGENIASDIRGYPVYSLEQIIVKRPDVILTAGRMNIERIKRDSIIIDDINPDIFMRPGPRVIEAIEKLHEKIDKIKKK